MWWTSHIQVRPRIPSTSSRSSMKTPKAIRHRERLSREATYGSSEVERYSVSFDPWSRSADLERLVAAGYELELTGDAYLLVHNVPYLDEQLAVQRGLVVTKLQLNGDVTVNPVDDHVAFFSGSTPYRSNGEQLTPLANANLALADGRVAQFSMSLKCEPANLYPDYF